MRYAVPDKARPGVSSLVMFDEDGFLIDTSLWTPHFAREMAEHAGLGELDAGHWEAIDYVREKYFGLGAMPPMRSMCRALGVEPTRIKASFGGCRSLLQIAGLPNPGGEVLAYLP